MNTIFLFIMVALSVAFGYYVREYRIHYAEPIDNTLNSWFAMATGLVAWFMLLAMVSR